MAWFERDHTGREWLFADAAEVTWAQVAGLGRTHDALDLGVSVARFSLDPARPAFGPLWK